MILGVDGRLIEAWRERVVVIEVGAGIGVSLGGTETLIDVDCEVSSKRESPVLIVLADAGVNRNSVNCDSDDSLRNDWCNCVAIMSSVRSNR